MCGRYSQTLELAELIKRFSLKPPPFNWKTSYNIAPGAMAPVVCAGGLKLFKWGFVSAWSAQAPSWRQTLFSAGNPLERKFSGAENTGAQEHGPEREGFMNARAEGIASRPSFRNAFYKSRCCVPADGFYEWQSAGGARIPHRFELRDKSVFAMAGIFEEATGTYAVITTVSNALMRGVHHRMPVILERKSEAAWLDPKVKDSEFLLPLLRPYDSALMHGYRVSDLVNDPKNDSPDCLKPVQL